MTVAPRPLCAALSIAAVLGATFGASTAQAAKKPRPVRVCGTKWHPDRPEELSCRNTRGLAKALRTIGKHIRSFSLTAKPGKAVDLAPVRHLTGLRKLELYKVKPRSLAPLASLTGLRRFEAYALERPAKSDFSAISRLKALRCIKLRGDDLGIDPDHFADLPQLRYADLGYLGLGRLPKGWTAPRLVYLSIHRNGLKTLSGIEGLTALRYLSFGANPVPSIEPLAKLKKLQVLIGQFAGVTRLDGIEQLPELVTIDLNFADELTDISALAKATGLVDIRLGYAKNVERLPSLTALKNLQTLNLGYTKVSDLGGLAGLTKLSYLNIGNTRVKEAPVLSGLTGLRSLVAKGTALKRLPDMRRVKQLQQLDLSYAGSLDDISGLATLEKLEYLALTHTSVRDLSALSASTRLRRINLSGLQTPDLSPLLGSAKTLVSLILTHVPTADVATLKKLRALESLYLQGTKIPTSADKTLKRGGDLVIKRKTSAFSLASRPMNHEPTSYSMNSTLCETEAPATPR